VLDHLGRQPPAAGVAACERFDLRPFEPVERQRPDMRTRRPGRRKYRAKGQHDQERRDRRLIDQLAEQVQCRRIGPMHVFPNLEQRLSLGFLQRQRDERVLGAFLQLLRRQGALRMAVVERQ
jgi:hypothetical protein